jgi:hypothetical protein
MNLDGSGFQVLQSFAAAGAAGSNPQGAVTLSADGTTLFATNIIGGLGSYEDGGTLFSLAVPQPVPEPSGFVLAGGLTALTMFALKRRKTARVSDKSST